jgi:hypothetical protein
VPGKDFLALLLKVGFNRAGLVNYTGFKSSPYTEGALFFGEKLAEPKAEAIITSLRAQIEEAQKIEGSPDSSG